MSRKANKTKRTAAKTALITVRVSPEVRDGLRQLAAQRGQTLSAMLLSPWLARGGARKSLARPRVLTAQPPTADHPDACKPVRAASAPERERVRVSPTSRAADFVGQGMLFDVAGSER